MRFVILAAMLSGLAGLSAGAVEKAPEKPGGKGVKLNPRILEAEANKWLTLHVQKKGDKCSFRRQAHGGSCFDSKRGRIVLFGSNTHSRDWKNSPFFFDVAREEWSRAYPDDSVKTYKVNEKGLPVAGEKGDHPWATHTFGAVMYDSKRDEMVIACYPGHMRPKKWGRAVKHLWDSVKKHPTWTYSMATGKWKALECKPTTFFPNSAAYDSDRGAVIGHKPGAIYELSGEPRKWSGTARGKEIPGWGHDNCAYDSKHKQLVIFGGNSNSNEVAVYDPAAKTLKLMPAKGARPPADQHNPMEFVPGLNQTVVLVDRTPKKDKAEKSTTETWLYDLGKDSWTHLERATLPFACGMNFNLEYDPHHKACLLVATVVGKTTVFALKIDPAKLSAKPEPKPVEKAAK
jgi:hypothetical protein